MTELAGLTRWMDAYRRAWNSNAEADIEALFSPDAVYRSTPFDPPWRGRARIVEGWLAHADQPGQTTFEWEPVVLTDELAIISAVTTYPTEVFSNLWLIRLDDAGRCTDFTEWWMEHPRPGHPPTTADWSTSD